MLVRLDFLNALQSPQSRRHASCLRSLPASLSPSLPVGRISSFVVTSQQKIHTCDAAKHASTDMYPYVMAQNNRIYGVNRSQLPLPTNHPPALSLCTETDSIKTTSAEHAHRNATNHLWLSRPTQLPTAPQWWSKRLTQ